MPTSTPYQHHPLDYSHVGDDEYKLVKYSPEGQILPPWDDPESIEAFDPYEITQYGSMIPANPTLAQRNTLQSQGVKFIGGFRPDNPHNPVLTIHDLSYEDQLAISKPIYDPVPLGDFNIREYLNNLPWINSQFITADYFQFHFLTIWSDMVGSEDIHGDIPMWDKSERVKKFNLEKEKPEHLKIMSLKGKNAENIDYETKEIENILGDGNFIVVEGMKYWKMKNGDIYWKTIKVGSHIRYNEQMNLDPIIRPTPPEAFSDSYRPKEKRKVMIQPVSEVAKPEVDKRKRSGMKKVKFVKKAQQINKMFAEGIVYYSVPTKKKEQAKAKKMALEKKPHVIKPNRDMKMRFTPEFYPQHKKFVSSIFYLLRWKGGLVPTSTNKYYNYAVGDEMTMVRIRGHEGTNIPVKTPEELGGRIPFSPMSLDEKNWTFVSGYKPPPRRYDHGYEFKDMKWYWMKNYPMVRVRDDYGSLGGSMEMRTWYLMEDLQVVEIDYSDKTQRDRRWMGPRLKIVGERITDNPFEFLGDIVIYGGVGGLGDIVYKQKDLIRFYPNIPHDYRKYKADIPFLWELKEDAPLETAIEWRDDESEPEIDESEPEIDSDSPDEDEEDEEEEELRGQALRMENFRQFGDSEEYDEVIFKYGKWYGEGSEEDATEEEVLSHSSRPFMEKYYFTDEEIRADPNPFNEKGLVEKLNIALLKQTKRTAMTDKAELKRKIMDIIVNHKGGNDDPSFLDGMDMEALRKMYNGGYL